MIVVDSSVWIAHLRQEDGPHVRQLKAVSRKRSIVVGDVVLLEVLQGARGAKDARRIEALLQQFASVQMMSREVVVEAARIYRALRADGITIRKTVDLIIATFCLMGDHHLLHSDRDFTPFAERFGLRLA